jgi:hypothetical protein
MTHEQSLLPRLTHAEFYKHEVHVRDNTIIEMTKAEKLRKGIIQEKVAKVALASVVLLVSLLLSVVEQLHPKPRIQKCFEFGGREAHMISFILIGMLAVSIFAYLYILMLLE